MTSRIDELVSNSAGKYPDNAAIIDDGKSVTYKELDRRVSILSSCLIEKGLKKGDRVGMLSRNSASFAVVYFAVSRAGGASVLLNHLLDPSDIIKNALNCGISAIYIGKGLEERGLAIRDNLKTLRFIVEDGASVRKERPAATVSPNDLSLIIYTAGTTAAPAGVMLSHKNLISNNASIVSYTGISEKDSIVCVLPFYYIFGLSVLLSHIMAGAKVIIENRFLYPNNVLDTIDKHQASGFAGVSSHYTILLYLSDLKTRKLPSLKYFMQAGDAMSPKETLELVRIFPDKRLFIMYGQTEASPRLSYLDPALVTRKPASVGRAMPGVELKVVNDSGRECAAAEPGEIIARGDNVMMGYLNDKKATAETIKNSWLYTGDIAYKDKDGDLFIVGRKKGFIKIGANRVNPAEIESVVLEDGRIMEAAAIDAEDPILGRRIRLFVTLVPGTKMTQAEITDICKRRLPSYKIPSKITILETMPKNGFGKVDEKKLRGL